VSEIGPNDDDDPFTNVPFLGDLANLFGSQGANSWEAARQLAVSVATDNQPEQNVDPLDRIELEQLARVAELQVTASTGLSLDSHGANVTVQPVTRSQWATRTLDDYKALLQKLGTSLSAAPEQTPEGVGDPGAALMAGLMGMLGPMLLGMTAGSMVGHLARRSLGQYDLPIPRPDNTHVMIVPANLSQFSDEWSLPEEELGLWVCINELAHHAILGVDHVSNRLNDLLEQYVSGFEPNPAALEDRFSGLDASDPSSLEGLQSMFGDPEFVLGAIQTDRQRALLPELEALICVIAGCVDHFADEIASGLVSSHEMISEAFRRRRVEAASADRFVERLLGLEMGPVTYERGEAFVKGVVDRAGEAGLARLWRSARELPTPAEIDAPGLWLARIDLPDD
jgi:putative hydrolase